MAHLWLPKFSNICIGGSTLVDARRTPPQGSRFFRFDIQNFRNVTASGVHAPPMRSTPPLRGNPGSRHWFGYQVCSNNTSVVRTPKQCNSVIGLSCYYWKSEGPHLCLGIRGCLYNFPRDQSLWDVIYHCVDKCKVNLLKINDRAPSAIYGNTGNTPVQEKKSCTQKVVCDVFVITSACPKLLPEEVFLGISEGPHFLRASVLS